MIFVVDIGNSRIKWGTYAQGRVRDTGEVEHGGERAAALEAVTGALPAAAERVVVANVGGDALATELGAAVRARHGIAVALAATRPAACGVRCAYADPARLGVDRWAALIGAYEPGAGPWVVVDAGTTVTVDVLGADGGHAGGLILAGPELAAESLVGRTARITRYSVRDVARPPAATLFGRDTGPAVVHGALLASAAVVDRAVAAATLLLGAAPRVILTGGLGPTLATWLETAAEPRADLVLEGLGRLAAASEEG